MRMGFAALLYEIQVFYAACSGAPGSAPLNFANANLNGCNLYTFSFIGPFLPRLNNPFPPQFKASNIPVKPLRLDGRHRRHLL